MSILEQLHVSPTDLLQKVARESKSLNSFLICLGYQTKQGILSGKDLKEAKQFLSSQGISFLSSKESYEKSPKACMCCGEFLPYEKRRGSFCNSTCSARFNNQGRIVSQETREKQSSAMAKRPGTKRPLVEGEVRSGKKILRKVTCKNCGNEFYSAKDAEYCQSPECKSVCYRLAQEVVIKEGRHKGWRTRNVTSFSERFFMRVLDNNGIKYVREYRVDKYFLDFKLDLAGINIDLEIDGKQHLDPERKKHDLERDAYLRSQGIVVYRIPWNEINSDQGKKLMKEKIDEFLDWLNRARRAREKNEHSKGLPL